MAVSWKRVLNAAPMRRIVAMTGLFATLASTACSVVGVRTGTEQPRYAVLDEIGPVEIRRYDRRLAAETTETGDEIASRNSGFRRLAGYIFGGNDGRARIAMTAPVAALRAPEGRWTIRFILPAGLATPPRPRDPSVRIVTVPAETVAVLRYSGTPGTGAVTAQTMRLERAVQASRWQPIGPAMAWFYDPPWTLPTLRRNEVVLPVRANDEAVTKPQ